MLTVSVLEAVARRIMCTSLRRKWQAWGVIAAEAACLGQSQLLRYARACHRAFRLDVLRVRGPRPGGVQLAGLELFAAS